MEIGIQAIGSIWRTPEEPADIGFRRIKEAGFDTVDFNFEMFEEFDNFFDPEAEGLYQNDIEGLKKYFLPYKEACAKEGLKFSQGHAPFGKLQNEKEGIEGAQYKHFLSIQKKVIEIAGWMGIPYLVVHPWITRKRQGLKAEWELNMLYYKELAPVAKAAGVALCLENMFDTVAGKLWEGPCSDPDEVNAYLDALEAYGDFAFCLDVGHINLFGRDMEDFIRKVGKRIKILHLHENDGFHDLHNMPFTFPRAWGSPTVQDWEGIIKGLKAIGYDGVLNFETGPVMYSVPEELNHAARLFIHAVGEYLSKRITYSDASQ